MKQQGIVDILLVVLLIVFIAFMSFMAGKDTMRLLILENCMADNSELPHNRVRTYCAEKTGIDKIDKH